MAPLLCATLNRRSIVPCSGTTAHGLLAAPKAERSTETTTTITSGIFRDNWSEHSSGAITFRTDGFVDPATVTGITLSGNQTTGEGGAILAYYEITVSSTFSRNRAGGDSSALISDMDLNSNVRRSPERKPVVMACCTALPCCAAL